MGLFGGSSQKRQPAAKPKPTQRRPVAKPAPAGEGEKDEGPVWGCPSMTILLKDAPSIDRKRLQATFQREFPGIECRIAGLFASQTDNAFANDPEKQAAFQAALGGDGGLSTETGFEARLGGQVITCLGMPFQAPGLEEMLQTSRSDREAIAQVLPGHASHVLCMTKAGPELGVETTANLFRLAVALEEQGAIGVIQVDAWQCFLVQRLRDHLTADAAEKLSGPYFPLVWCNAIPFHGEGGSWMTSKGFAVAGVPDIAIWVRSQPELAHAGELLGNLFHYLHKGAKLKHGETLQMEGCPNFRIGPVTEHHDFLCGRGETIALTPV